MLDFRPLKHQVINFVDLESQKGFVYLLFLAPFFCDPFLSLMGSISSFLCVALVRISFFSRSRFLRLSTCLSRFPCLSLSIPPFSALQRLHPPEQCLDLVHRYGSTVKIRQWPKTSIFRFLHQEEKSGNAGERYRQPLKDRINKMESKVVECFWYVDQTSGWCYVQHFKVI